MIDLAAPAGRAPGGEYNARGDLDWTEKLYWGDHLPEFYTGTTPCEHTPLAWSHSLALRKVLQ